MANFVYGAHSGVRYLVLLLAVLAIGAALAGLRTAAPTGRAERVLGTAYVGVLDLQLLLGLLMLVYFPFYGQLMGHITMMVLAAVVAHVVSVRARKRESGSKVRAIGFVASLVLIIGGILAIQKPVL